VHVEHFKQDLNREVMAMTEEVGRLHREKQMIENQISDLFAFYSKHKQQNEVCKSDVCHLIIFVFLIQYKQPNRREAQPELIQHSATTTSTRTRESARPPRAHIPRSHHRPLPYPGGMS